MAYGERGSVGFATPAEKIFEVRVTLSGADCILTC